MTRPIGKNIIDICLLLEALGPCTSLRIADENNGMEAVLAYQYCNRANAHGFVSRSQTAPFVYTVAPNWRDLVAVKRTWKPKPLVAPIEVLIRPRTLPMAGARNSVFDVRIACE